MAKADTLTWQEMSDANRSLDGVGRHTSGKGVMLVSELYVTMDANTLAVVAKVVILWITLGKKK